MRRQRSTKRQPGPERRALDRAYEAALREKREELTVLGFVEWGRGRDLSALGPHAKAIFGRSPLNRLLARVGGGASKEYWVQEWALCVYASFKSRYAVAEAVDVSALIRAACERCMGDDELCAAVAAAFTLGAQASGDGDRAVVALLLPKRPEEA